uniref:Epidermal patterning factor-like protein n=1 Tax=Kalanchoe fedtschenkoi TaxID=63787 RepID=A0A7N0T5I2_KALFE
MESGRKRRRLQVIHRFSFYHNIVSIFVLASLFSTLRLLAEGRAMASQVAASQGMAEEEVRIMRSQIGSRPPKCDRRCYSCGHCEAIQVPTNPQVASTKRAGAAGVSRTAATAYSRGDYGSNYKPMSWKCKCGNSIFNP